MGAVHSLWPLPPDPAAACPVTDAELERLYDYPDGLTEPWVQVNFVSSADGAVAVADRSAALSHSADKRIFALGRDLADVVLVGAGTAHAERYRGVRAGERRSERRRRLGRSDVPPIAVVSGRCSIAPDDALVTDTVVAPIVLTTSSAPAERRTALADAGVDVVVAGEHDVDLRAGLAALADRGLLRVDCEGGPHLFGSLVADDLVDQLCLTVAPLLAGAGAGRVVAGRPAELPRGLRLASLLHEDGFTMYRYRRASERA